METFRDYMWIGIFGVIIGLLWDIRTILKAILNEIKDWTKLKK